MAVDYVGIATVLAASTSLVTAAAGAYARVKFGNTKHGDDDDAELDELRQRIDDMSKRRGERPDDDLPGRHERRMSLPVWRLSP